MIHKSLIGVVAAAAVGLGAASSSRGADGVSGAPVALTCPPRGGDLRPTDLRGRWTAELTPDSVRSLPDARIGRPLAAAIRLARRDSSVSAAIYSGEYAADLQSVGLARASGDVMVIVPRGDSVHVILDVNVDHGNIELSGVCRGDRIAGTWVRTSAPARAWGRFTLRPD